MNKISKKIVALATMAAFVLTLVPAAAFAADDSNYVNSNVDIQKSGIYAVEKGNTSSNAYVAPGEDVTLQFEINNSDGAGVADTDLATPADKVKVWAVNNDTKKIATGVTFNGYSAAPCTTTGDNVWKLGESVQDGSNQLTVQFASEGNYTVYAGVGDFTADGALSTVAPLAMSVNVTVEDDSVIDRIEVYPAGSQNALTWDEENFAEINLIGSDFDADGTDVYTMDAYAFKGDKRAVKETITLISGNNHLQLLGDEDAETDGVQVTTDNYGKFNISFRMDDNRNVPITIAAGDVKYTLNIVKEESTPYDIDTTVDDGYVLAGNDTHWTEDARVFTDAVQFSVKDITGEAITGSLVDLDANGDVVLTNGQANGEPAAYNGYTNGKAHAEKFSIESAPAKSDIEATDLVLYWDENHGVYTLKYVGGDRQHDLIPGEYKVRLSLNSGDYTEATFNVAKFGTVQDTVLDMWAVDRSAQNRTVDITDEVTLGQDVYVSAKYVDENGLKIDATDVNFGFDGKAVVDRNVNHGNGFATKDDIAANESLLGTTITVTAFSKTNHQLVQQELTVVDSYNSFSLEFDPTEGAVNEDNKVTVSVVDEDGDVAQVRGTMEAYVADKSNEDAVVTIDTSNVSNGKGTLTVYASEPTEVDIVVAVDDATNEGLYAGTLTYTAGKGDITAHHEVVMTIGSSQYVVDKQLFTMDAAPYVDSNWRTMVPIRALAEAFDATVTYDNDARTVTIEYNEQTIVMTIDDATYSVNGVEAEMDTEAVINSADDRTYVPVRFAAEAMGFTVTALYDENSSTASVVFQS